MRKYEELEFWQKAHSFTLKIYKLIESLPDFEKYNITSQLRRSSVSIGANIVEGSAKTSNIDYKRFLEISLGSASECEYYLILMHDLNYLSNSEFQNLSKEVLDIRKMLFGYIKQINISNSRVKEQGSRV